MTVPRKVGADGRATNKVAGKHFRKALGLPQGVGFSVPLPGDLLNSPAWLGMSDQCRKLIDALMAEHADHGGFENGSLKAPYDTLQARGMRRGTILDAIFEANALGIAMVAVLSRIFFGSKPRQRFSQFSHVDACSVSRSHHRTLGLPRIAA